MIRPDPRGGPRDHPSPSWLHEPCPGWCTRVHEEDDHLEDRFHQSEPTIVPVIAAVEPTVPVTASLETIDLVIRIGRYDGELVEWLTIEPLDLPQPKLVLTVESARLLAHHLAEQLDRHAAG